MGRGEVFWFIALNRRSRESLLEIQLCGAGLRHYHLSAEVPPRPPAQLTVITLTGPPLSNTSTTTLRPDRLRATSAHSVPMASLRKTT